MHRSGRDVLILALGVLPSLVLGVAWMRQTGVPAAVYLQNVAAVIVGFTVAIYGVRRQAPPSRGLIVAVVAIVLLLATLVSADVEGVHRWIRVGPLAFHVASVVIPFLLVELRAARLAIGLSIMFVVAAILAIQPDAGQATAFAGSCIVLLAGQLKRNRVAVVGGMLAMLTLASLSFLRRDPLPPVPHVEEIAVRIAQQGAAWQAAVFVALALLIVPFVMRRERAGVAVAVYLALAIAASYWGNYPVPVLGYGMSPILGYFIGWMWLHARAERAPSVPRDPYSSYSPPSA